MLTKKTLERARAHDRAYGGDGNCSHRFGGPEPAREPAHWREEVVSSNPPSEEKK